EVHAVGGQVVGCAHRPVVVDVDLVGDLHLLQLAATGRGVRVPVGRLGLRPLLGGPGLPDVGGAARFRHARQVLVGGDGGRRRRRRGSQAECEGGGAEDRDGVAVDGPASAHVVLLALSSVVVDVEIGCGGACTSWVRAYRPRPPAQQVVPYRVDI